MSEIISNGVADKEKSTWILKGLHKANGSSERDANFHKEQQKDAKQGQVCSITTRAKFLNIFPLSSVQVAHMHCREAPQIVFDKNWPSSRGRV